MVGVNVNVRAWKLVGIELVKAGFESDEEYQNSYPTVLEVNVNGSVGWNDAGLRIFDMEIRTIAPDAIVELGKIIFMVDPEYVQVNVVDVGALIVQVELVEGTTLLGKPTLITLNASYTDFWVSEKLYTVISLFLLDARLMAIVSKLVGVVIWIVMALLM